jgi:hypothetical protein
MLLRMLAYGWWRIFLILDWATDFRTMLNVVRFSPGWGFVLVMLIMAPYFICAVGMYNVVLREIPRFLDKHKIELKGTDTLMLGYMVLAPVWVFILDAVINIRFFFWPIKGHYLQAFDRMRRITLIFVDAGLVTLVDIQVLWTNIIGVKSSLLSASIGISFVNLAFNMVWLYRLIAAQHRPWNKYIKNAFRGGLSHIPHLDDVRDGIKQLEYFTGIEHSSEVMAVSQALIDAGKLCRVEHLLIQRCNVDDDGAQAVVTCLQSNTTLTSLNFDYNDVSGVVPASGPALFP